MLQKMGNTVKAHCDCKACLEGLQERVHSETVTNKSKVERVKVLRSEGWKIASNGKTFAPGHIVTRAHREAHPAQSCIYLQDY